MSSIQNYVKIKVVGKGTFGQAVLVKSKTDNQQYIMKQINMAAMNKKEKEESLNEVKILSILNHPNVIRYVDSFEDNNKLCIIMEYAECGDLYSKIKTQKGVPFKEEQILDWFIQICLAVKHCHDKKILHRDLKTQNIFISKTNTIKLGDFGIARVLRNTMEQAKTMVGTPYYLSPELCQEKPYNNKSDIWALGCILYELVTQRHAFEGHDMRALVGRILRGVYPPVNTRYSKDLRDLIDKMLQKDPKSRPSITSILNTPYIKKRLEAWVIEEGIDVEVETAADDVEAIKKKEEKDNIKGAEVLKNPNNLIKQNQGIVNTELNKKEEKEAKIYEKIQDNNRNAHENIMKRPINLVRKKEEKEIETIELEKKIQEKNEKLIEERKLIEEERKRIELLRLKNMEKRRMEERERLKKLAEIKRRQELEQAEIRRKKQEQEMERKRQEERERRRAYEEARLQAYRNRVRHLQEEQNTIMLEKNFTKDQSKPEEERHFSDNAEANAREEKKRWVDNEKVENPLAEYRRQQYWEMRKARERNRARAEEQIFGTPSHECSREQHIEQQVPSNLNVEQASQEDAKKQNIQDRAQELEEKKSAVEIKKNNEVQRKVWMKASSSDDYKQMVLKMIGKLNEQKDKVADADDIFSSQIDEESPVQLGAFGKFQLNGKTLCLKNVSEKDSLYYRIESLRAYIGQELGEDTFIKVYSLLENQKQNNDDDILQEKIIEILGSKEKLPFINLIHQLIFCEEVQFANSS